MVDIISVLGVLIAVALSLILAPLCPISLICWPLCTCSVPLSLMLLTTLGGLLSYWTTSSGMTSGMGSYVPSISELTGAGGGYSR